MKGLAFTCLINTDVIVETITTQVLDVTEDLTCGILRASIAEISSQSEEEDTDLSFCQTADI